MMRRKTKKRERGTEVIDELDEAKGTEKQP